MPSRKRLRSIARSVADHFVSTLNYWKDDYAIHHIWKASIDEDEPIIVIDVLACKTIPEGINHGRVAEVLPPLRNFFFELLQKENFLPEDVFSAKIRFHFRRRMLLLDLPVYSCHVDLNTPDGQIYTARFEEIDPLPAGPPDDFQAALNKNPEAKDFFTKLNRQSQYAFLMPIQTAENSEMRQRRIERFISMLEKHEKLYP